MAASPASSHLRSRASSTSASSLKRDSSIDSLVTHLLAAKRSLSSMTLVLRANELVTSAQALHEDAALLGAQAGFLRGSILDQVAVMMRLRRSLVVTYDWGKRDFKRLVRAMDEVDGQLEETMGMLRGTEVKGELRGEGERMNLLDYVDEGSVDGMREAMKKSIQDLQGIQQSFDGDLLRLDTDIRHLKKIIVDAPDPDGEVSPGDLLVNMLEHSSSMAALLTSLTTHFDLCVKAVRTTDGAVALARRRAAEAPSNVSISGVIGEQEGDLEPDTKEDRAEMLKVVVQDAGEVDDVVGEISERLAAVESDHEALVQRAEDARAAMRSMLSAHAALEAIGSRRLPSYLSAEDDFKGRWDVERAAVFDKLGEMRDMRDFYEGYASAYGSLLLEMERRRAVEEKMEGLWRKAREGVQKLAEQDERDREAFRAEVGEYLPTDLWAGVRGKAKRWEVKTVEE